MTLEAIVVAKEAMDLKKRVDNAIVYHVTSQKTQNSNAATIGMLSIVGHLGYVVFDSGATYSFLTSHIL